MRSVKENPITARTRLIQRLLEDNFDEVEGPHVEYSDGDLSVIFLLCGNDVSDTRPRMRIQFPIQYLSKRENEFPRHTLSALQEAKRILYADNGMDQTAGTITVSEEGVGLSMASI